MMPGDDLDVERNQREEGRWLILYALHLALPGPLSESNILKGLLSVPVTASLASVRRDLDYLRSKGLLEIVSKRQSLWVAKLTAYGVDVVEFAKDCPPGILRPEK